MTRAGMGWNVGFPGSARAPGNRNVLVSPNGGDWARSAGKRWKMLRDLQRNIDREAACFLSGNFGPVLEFFAEELTVFSHGDITVCRDHTELLDRLTKQHASLVALGLSDIRAKIASRSLPRNGRARTQIDWIYSFGENGKTAHVRTSYFFDCLTSACKVAMIDCGAMEFSGPAKGTANGADNPAGPDKGADPDEKRIRAAFAGAARSSR